MAQLIHCINFHLLSTYRMASAVFDVELKSFIITLYTCDAAVYLATNPGRKETLKNIEFLCVYQSQKYAKHSDLLNQSNSIQMDKPWKKFANNYWRTFDLKYSI